MTDHRDRFIFVQSMGKPIVESLVTDNVYKEMTNDEILRHISWWCHKLYNLAGELGPQDQDDGYIRMHPNSMNAYRKKILKFIEGDDTLGLVELRNELEQGQWAWVLNRLYTEDARTVRDMLQNFDVYANEPDPDYVILSEGMSEKDKRRGST